MSLTTAQLAELLAGIARSQQAIIDAIESESGGWRNTHLLPKLNTAANMRIANVRLLDLPSRVLLRSQGRVPMDVATITRDLELAIGSHVAPATSAAAGAATTATPAAAIASGASAPAVPATAKDDDEFNFFDS
jgi:hypothetical protein